MNNNYYNNNQGHQGGNIPPQRPQMPQRARKNQKSRFPVTELFIGLLAITAVFVLIWTFASGKTNNGKPDSSESTNATLNYDEVNGSASSDTSKTGDESDKTTFDPNEYTEITLLNMGDIMYHNPQLDNAYNHANGTYDFSGCYKYIKDIVSAADYAVVNFEATLSGEDYTYAGYPTFNAPDSAFTALVDAGFDMMLFANNHCYDYQHHGLIRTQEVFKKSGVDYIGARLSTDEKTYKTVDVNGISIGMLNTTDDLRYGNLDERTVNGITIQGDDLTLLDLFNHGLLDEFYAQTEARIKELKDGGADIIIYYIHWGDEYYLTHNDMQDQLAQKLCDLGVDVIIGGHPHVIQDAEMLTSSVDSSHKTLCFYSLGNVISNQNRLTMGELGDYRADEAYTENGLMVELTIRKYTDGTCLVTKVRTIPTWVHRYYNSTSAKMSYEVLPVEAAISDPGSYGLYNSNFGVTHATAALKMTNDTLGGIIEAFAATVVLPTGENASDK